MKTLAFFLSLTAICLSFNNVHAIGSYYAGDTLYVWAKSGLSLRTAPGFQAAKIALLPFGTCVIPQSSKYEDNADSVVTEALKAATDGQGGKKPAYRIKGSWVKVRANGQEGYVFDGYLSALLPFDKNPELINRQMESPDGEHQHLVIYKNGIYHQRSWREVGSYTKYVLPNATLAEGFLFANHLLNLERVYAKAFQDKDGQLAVEFEQDLLSFEWEFEADGHYFLGGVSIQCVSNTVIIGYGSEH